MANEAGNGRISPVDEAQLLRAAACDWRLSRGDVGVLAVILAHCDDKWRAFPGPTTISKQARLAVTNVKASLKHLETLYYIEVIRPGLRKANRFIVQESPSVPSRTSCQIIKGANREMRKSGTELGMRTYPRLGTKSYPDREVKRGRN